MACVPEPAPPSTPLPGALASLPQTSHVLFSTFYLRTYLYSCRFVLEFNLVPEQETEVLKELIEKLVAKTMHAEM